MGDDVQTKLAELQEKGWTLANIARELGQAIVTVESWKAGKRSPANAKAILAMLDQIAKIKRIPKRRRYTKNSRKQND